MPTAYNFKTTLRASAAHISTGLIEHLASTGTAGAASDSALQAKSTTTILMLYTTAYGVPNNADWPNGTYKAVLDVSAAGVDLTYGLKTINAIAGHFGRVADTSSVDGLGESDAQTVAQAESAFTGTGVKTATVSWDPSAGATTDVFEAAICVQNANSKDSQTLTIDVNDGSSYLEFPDAGTGEIILQSVAGVASVSNIIVGTPRVTLQSVAGVASLSNLEVATPAGMTLQGVAGIAALPNVEVATPARMSLDAIAGAASLPNVDLTIPATVTLQSVAGVGNLPNVTVTAPFSPLTLQGIAGIAALPNVEVSVPAYLALGTVAGIGNLPNLEVATPTVVVLQSVAGVATLPNVEVATPAGVVPGPVAGLSSLSNVEVGTPRLNLQNVIGNSSASNLEVATPAAIALDPTAGTASLANVAIDTPAPPAGGDRGLLLEMQA